MSDKLTPAERERDELREACEFAREAIRENLKMYTHKNEPLLYEAFKNLGAALAAKGVTDGKD